MTELSFAGRRIVVTGAGRGIGREYALLLAARGAQVAVVDLGSTPDGGDREAADPAAAVVAEITAAGGRAIALRADVSTEEGSQGIVDAAVDAFGGLDALINNAGIVRTASFDEVPREEYQRHLDVHFFGSLWLTKSAWPHLRESGTGRIVNTVSAAMLGNPLMVHYGSSKGAVFGLTRNLAIEGAPYGIHVNAVAPGAGTRMAEAAADSLPPEVMEYMRTALLPSLVAPVGAYLVHPDCAVTGEVFNVAGGFVNRMAVVNTAGFHDPDLSVDSVAARFGEVMALPDGVDAQTVPLPQPTGQS